MSTNIQYCKTCGIKAPDSNTCQLNGTIIDPETDYCSKHASELKICDMCHQPYLGQDVIHCQNGEYIKITCMNCASKMGHCVTCAHGINCKFETDPSPIPPVVNQVIRQGNMTMQTQVRNPERIKITCAAGCPCWHTDDEGGFCCREYSTCGEYAFIGF